MISLPRTCLQIFNSPPVNLAPQFGIWTNERPPIHKFEWDLDNSWNMNHIKWIGIFFLLSHTSHSMGRLKSAPVKSLMQIRADWSKARLAGKWLRIWPLCQSKLRIPFVGLGASPKETSGILCSASGCSGIHFGIIALASLHKLPGIRLGYLDRVIVMHWIHIQ